MNKSSELVSDFHIVHQHSGRDRREKKVAVYRRCNICRKRFRSVNGRILYCRHCRQESEVLRFYDHFYYGFAHAWALN